MDAGMAGEHLETSRH